MNDNDNAIYFDSFEVNKIQKKKKIIGRKNIVTNIYRTQAYN